MDDSSYDLLQNEPVDNLGPEGGFSPPVEAIKPTIVERPGGVGAPVSSEAIIESAQSMQAAEQNKESIRRELSHMPEVDNRLDMNPEATARMMDANQKVMEEEAQARTTQKRTPIQAAFNVLGDITRRFR